MKKILPIFICAALATGSVDAASHLSLRGVSRAKAKIEKRDGDRKATHKRVRSTGLWHKVSTPPRLQTRAEETHQEIKLLNYTYTSTDMQEAEKYTYSYDEYGFPKEIAKNDGSSVKYTYVWKVPGKVWSEKTETHMYGTEVLYSHKTTREFHPNGSVSKHIEDGMETCEYDENGYLIKRTDSNGYGESYFYFPLINEWFSGQIAPESVTEYVIGDTSIEEIRKQKINDVWYVMDRNVRYYNEAGESIGNFNESYAFDGEQLQLSYVFGSRMVITRDDKNVSRVNEYYDADSKKWVPQNKEENSLNYYETPWTYSPGEVYYQASYNYDVDASTWVLSYSDTYTWVNEKVVKNISKDSEGEYTYYFITGIEEPSYEGDNGLTGVSYDEKTGDYAYSITDPANENVELYFICKADGTVLRKFRESYNVWTEWNGTAWVKCTGTIEVAEDSDDSYKITFDSEGRVVRMDSYEDGVNDYYELYSYPADGGMLIATYESDDAGTFHKSYEEYIRLNADGTVAEEWDKSIDSTGEPYYGHRRVFYANGVYGEYSWNEDSWGEPQWYKNTDRTEASDGTITEISYYAESQDKYVPQNKNVYREDENGRLTEYWLWDVATNAWIGDTKTVERFRISPDFECKEAEDPKIINDDYFVVKYPYPDYARAWDASYNYAWDADAKDWKLMSAYGYEFNKKDDTTLEVVDLGNNTKHLVKVDSNRRIISLDLQSWEYDADGRVLKYTEAYDYDPTVRTYEYTYGEITVKGSGVKDIDAASDKSVIAVYDLNGVAVDGENLSNGVYVVKYSDGSTRKLLVK